MIATNPARLHPFRITALVGLFVILAAGSAWVLPAGVDWQLTFRPATLALAHGQSPYSAPSLQAPFANPPWALIPLIPLALLPEAFGRGLLFAVSILAFITAAIRLGESCHLC